MDRPDIVRCQYNLKRLAITDLKVDVPRLVKKKELSTAFDGARAFSVGHAPQAALLRWRQLPESPHKRAAITRSAAGLCYVLRGRSVVGVRVRAVCSYRRRWLP